jgi:KipI family sensor histidine kinase inhibitor
MRLRPCGDEAILVEFDDPGQVLPVHLALQRRPPAGLVDCVPAARTVLVVFDPARTTAQQVAAAIPHPTATQPATAGALLELPVAYDGADLGDVAERTGLTVDEVIERHTRPTYTVAFCGFSPGFGYLTGLDPALRLPRRPSPRLRVPAGAVAIADRYSGIYPRPTPGGWHLLGRTDRPVWTLDREPPALLRPGCRVRFVAAGPHL